MTTKRIIEGLVVALIAGSIARYWSPDAGVYFLGFILGATRVNVYKEASRG